MRISQTIARNAQVAAHHTATRFGARERTWTEHVERVARLAGGMRALGVADGDRVAALALNSDRYLEWFYATSWAGAVFVPVNTRLATPEIVHWLEDSGSSRLFVDDQFLDVVPTLRKQVGPLREVCYIGDGPAPAGMVSFEDLVASADAVESSGRGDDDLAGLFYTGGTTGTSKGVMLSHRNLLTNSLHVLSDFDYRPDTVYLHAAPMFHLANGMGMFLTALVGATSVMIPRFTPRALLDAVEKHRVTSTILVPTMINMITQEPAATEYDLSSWETLVYGGSPMTETTILDILSLAPELHLIQTYGQTEASPVVTLLKPKHHVFDGPLAGKTRSAGQAVYGVELAILDAAGRELPNGHVGEICARADTVMLGYYNQPDVTAQSLRDGWLHTQDAGYLDDEGFLYVVDRLKEMIVSGGENVYAAEVENALATHPAASECAVIGIPSEKWGEQVHAVVSVAAGSEVRPVDLIAHCKQLIATYKCPRSVEIRTEELPKSGAEKIMKHVLRKPHWEGRERPVN